MGLNVFKKTINATSIGDVAMVEEKMVFVFFIADNVVYTAGVKRTAAADDAMDCVTLL